MMMGTCMYLFFSFLGLSTLQYHHAVTPSLTERAHPLKTARKVNDTYHILDAFRNIYYDPYDLYM